MGPALGQADSFNSSGATIVPDNHESGSRLNTRSRLSAATTHGQQVPSLVTQARMLMPQDTLGRELDELVAMSNGGAGDDGSVNVHDWSLNVDQSDGSAPFASQPTRELTFSQIFGSSSSPGRPAESFLPDVDMISRSDNHLNSNSYQQSGGSTQDDFRPSSARSHTSNSEYSYSSTDVDTDSVMSDSNPQPRGPNHHLGADLGGLNMAAEGLALNTTSFWINPSQLNNGFPPTHARTIRPDVDRVDRQTTASESVSPPEAGNLGPVRGHGEDAAARDQRLAHRRQINRKSAQKHRKRRKEEMDVLTQQVVDRDREIALLKRDLAVERARVDQLAQLVKNSGIAFGHQPAAW